MSTKVSLASRQHTPQPKIETTLALDKIVFDGDRDLRAELLKSRELAKFWKHIEASGPSPDGRLGLLKTSIRLTPGITPTLFKAIDHCRKVLGMTAPVDVFCTQSAESNAFVIPPRGGRITMGITNLALQTLTDSELVSVVGHEFGHVLFDHFALRPLLQFENHEELAPVDAMRLYAWMRYAELTADRVGLLCCDDYDTAVSMQFKMISGLSEPRVLGDIKEAAAQYASLTAEAMERDANDWFSTHPYSPMRLRTLELFHKSRTFGTLRGRPGGSLSEKDLEAEVMAVMDLMNPSFLSKKTTCRRESRELLAYGGVAVAAADEKIDRSEIKAIKRLVGEGKLVDKIDELAEMPAEQRTEKIIELTNMLRAHLPLVRRKKLVEDLCAIAMADKQIMQSEANELYALCGALGVDVMFVDETLSRPATALD
jgi:uncharacterized tellurite resistance protein B-like protein